MTVIEHVKLAHYSKIRYGLFAAFIGTPAHHREEAEIGEKAVRLLDMMGIRHLADQVVLRITSYNVCYTKLLRMPSPVGDWF